MARVHDAGSSSWYIAGVVVGGLREYSAAAIAPGAADDRLLTELPDPLAKKNVLHTDRVHLTESSADVCNFLEIDSAKFVCKINT